MAILMNSHAYLYILSFSGQLTMWASEVMLSLLFDTFLYFMTFVSILQCFICHLVCNRLFVGFLSRIDMVWYGCHIMSVHPSICLSRL